MRGTSRGIAHLLASVEDRSVSHAHVQIENLYENQICLSETEISLTIVISLLLKGPPFPDRAHCFHVPKALLPLWVSATSPVMSKQAWLVPVMMCGRTWWVGVFFIRYFPHWWWRVVRGSEFLGIISSLGQSTWFSADHDTAVSASLGSGGLCPRVKIIS